MIRKLFTLTFSLIFLSMSSAACWADDSGVISDVSLSADSFNPSINRKVTLSFSLERDEQLTVYVYDPDDGLIRVLEKNKPYKKGKHQIVWDGRDGDKKIVPDEAYTFVIETPHDVYDPTTFSGGVVGDITQAEFNDDGSVIYKLPSLSRVLFRTGIDNGPMYNTLVDWKPRLAGSVSEYWDGFDQDGLVKLKGHPEFSSLITYVTLPETTVIAYGNKKDSYRQYKMGRGEGKAQKPKRARKEEKHVRLRPEKLVPPSWVRAPQVSMIFPKHKGDKADYVPTVKNGSINVRIDVDEEDKPELQKDQFEVLLFINNVFFAEAERGYIPLNWRWELDQLPAGEHVLSVNVSSFSGQVGIASRKIIIEK